MSNKVDAGTLKGWLHDGGEFALLDMREHGEYGESHLFYAVPLPYSRLERDLERLVPRKSVRLIVYDDGITGVADKAARRAEALGYTDVSVLDGGTAAWKTAGYGLFAGVNVPSKTFGELVEHAAHVPVISAAELNERRSGGEDILILDGRPPAEHRKMNVPGSICCPNGELVYRIGSLAPDPSTPIVVHCAGRTRSIIGAQMLRDFGVPNPVYALENGTMGWSLAGLQLEHGSTRVADAEPGADKLESIRQRSQAFAAEHGLSRVEAGQLRAWLADPERTTYVLDVRTREEFDRAHLAIADHAPGGQLIQAGDEWLGTRNARIVLTDGDEIRAIYVANWLRQLGWEAHVLAGGREGWAEIQDLRRPPSAVNLPALSEVPAAELRSRPVSLLDVRASAAYQAGHIEGAIWASRARLDKHVARLTATGESVILIADEAVLARSAAMDLIEAGLQVAGWSKADPEGWRSAGLTLAATPDVPADDERIDFLFFVHDRHDGNLAAARQYIAWETGLVAQLDESEMKTFALTPA